MINEIRTKKKFFLLFVTLCIAFTLSAKVHAASVIVAASNSTAEGIARADVVCDGTDDQIELSASFTGSRHSVEWLPGDYYLSDTVTIVPHGNGAIDAEGAYFHYLPTTGDAVHVQGMINSRLRFGVIETSSTGAAIRLQNPPGVNGLMSILSWVSLIGHNQQGTGLYLDVSEEGHGTDRFEGSEIVGFDTGIFLKEVAPSAPGGRKQDTNWFFVNSIRECNTCIQEEHNRVDDHVYKVGLELSLPGSVGMRIGQTLGKYNVTMTDISGVDTKALILDPGAAGNVIEIHPPIETFSWQDNSGSLSNVILSTLSPPYKPLITELISDFDLDGRVEIDDLAILSAAWLGAAVSPVYWDLTEDWSDSINPNGVWSYNDAAGNPIITHVDNWVGMHGAGQPAWAPSNDDVPGWAKINGDVSSWADLPIGCIDTHNPSSLTWTSPRNDTILISGGLWVGPDRDRTVDWSIQHNSLTLTSSIEPINHDSGSSDSPVPFSDGSGGSDALLVSVNAGDFIKFNIGGGEHTGITVKIRDAGNPNLYTDDVINWQDFSIFSTEWLKELSQ